MPVEFEMKVVKIGDSLRMTIPREICKSMGIVEGSTVGVTLTDGTFVVRKLARSGS